MEPVGEGGMAQVYRGIDRVLSRPVAIKVMLPHLANKESARRRFEREARAVALLKHPDIVEIYDFSAPESKQAFIISEFVDGPSLATLLEQRKAFLPEVAAAMAWVMAGALAHAHSKGVVHRDVKPENVLVTSKGQLKLTDFGVAYIMGQSRLTATKALVGSPAHMSPEQVTGAPIDHRSDIFSLGTMLFLLATGKYPYTGDTDVAVIRQIAEAGTPDPFQYSPSFPRKLGAIITRMMAHNPEQRFQSMEEVADALAGFLSDLGITDIKGLVADSIIQGPDFCRELARHLSQVYATRAAALIEQGKPALSMEMADRALALDPHNKSAHRLARTTSKQQGVQRMLIALLLLLLAFPIGYHLWPGRSKMPVSLRLQLPCRPPQQRYMTVGRRRPAHVPEAKIPPRPKLIPVEIRAFPPAVRIAVDNKMCGFGSTGRLYLRPGIHRVVLIHPNCPVCARTVRKFSLSGTNPPRHALRFSIAYKPAVLVVKYPTRALVLADSKPIGYTNRNLHYPVASAQGSVVSIRVKGSKKTHKIKVLPGKKIVIDLSTKKH